MTGPKTKAARFDLEERTAKFGADSVRFARTIPDTPIARPLVSQLVRAATSVGANQCEADDAETRKDFLHKLGICKKEAHETKHWLRMVVVAAPELRADGPHSLAGSTRTESHLQRYHSEHPRKSGR